MEPEHSELQAFHEGRKGHKRRKGMVSRFIPPHGGYQKLISYQKAVIIFDGTVHFTNKFFRLGDRTIDQMVQAARSGKQNIVEASQASGTSKEMEIKLMNVARASQEELLVDYQDFLRVHNLLEWPKDHLYVQRFRELNRQMPISYITFQKAIEHDHPEISANVIIFLINIRRLEQDFLKDGGLRERMTRARLASRNKF